MLRIHFSRVTSTDATTGVASFPTASLACAVTDTLPLPSAPDENVASAKFAGNVNDEVAVSYVTVQVNALPAIEHVEPAWSAPLPWSSGARYTSLTVKVRLYLPSPARQK